MTILTNNTEVTKTDAASTDATKVNSEATTTDASKVNTEGDKKPGATTVDASAKAEDKSKTETETKVEVKGAPEKYADFKLPEGISIAPDMLTKFTDTAKKMNLTQEQAQELVKLTSENALAKQAADNAAYEQRQAKWVKEIKEDKEYGGDKFNETVERAKRGLKAFGNPELTTMLGESGLGDNPAIIKLFASIDKKIGDDKVVDGKPVQAKEGKSPAQVMYGK